MATIRAFTTIEQSRKLADILSLESADMLWGYYYNGKNHCIPNIRPFRDGRNEIPKCYTPAWSLAALLEIIKKLVGYSLQSLDTHTVFMNCELGDRPYNIETENYDNPVDACVDMILKLNEFEML